MKCHEGLVRRLIDVIFNPTILEELKQKHKSEFAEALSLVLTGDDAMVSSHACREEAESLRRFALEEKTRVFLELPFVNSMLHKVQNVSYSSIGVFYPSFEMGCFSSSGPIENLGRRGHEAIGTSPKPVLQSHFSQQSKEAVYGLVCVELECSGPALPPGFEDSFGGAGHTS